MLNREPSVAAAAVTVVLRLPDEDQWDQRSFHQAVMLKIITVTIPGD